MDNPKISSIDEGVELHLKGQLDEAESVYRRVLVDHPGNSDALHLLGVIAYQRKRYDEAADLIQRAILYGKRVADYRNNLGNVYLAQGKLDEAEACYRKALKLNPKYADAHNNLGNVYRERGRLREAVDSYQKAVKLDPTKSEIHNNLGMVLDGLDRGEEAISHYREAVRLKPDFCDAYSNIGAALKAQGKLVEAIEICMKALALNPCHAKTLLNLGNAHSEIGQIEKGISFFREALRAEPDLCEAHLNLGHALREKGEKEEAAIQFQKALALKPTSLAVRLGNCIGQIPLLHDSAEEIAATRANYRKELEKLAQEIDLSNLQILNQARRLVGNCQPFFLAYQGANDRELQSIYGDLMVRIQSACFPTWSRKRSMPARRPGEPIRVGIVSGFYFLHSNWKIPIKGWVENLDRKKFQLFGYYTRHTNDSQTEIARNSFYRFYENMTSLEQWCDRICSDRLHILIFPEICMDSMTVRLASLRLAPIQCTSWGHPDTSGLPTIDYYLSSDLMEPADAENHYSEKLVRLPNLSIHYDPIAIEPARIRRTDLGLREGVVVFLCTQSLFKYLPHFDGVFPRIASEVGECQFAFLNYVKSPRLGERFALRLEEAFARHGLRCADYVKFLPHLDPSHYQALNRLGDVFLDSIGWSGCNSTLEALACNLPVVTMPGRMMRGRHTHAIMQMMGFKETEARDIDEYVAIAKRLGTDAEWRRYISEQISQRKHLAYRDRLCIQGLEEFLSSAVESPILS